MADAAIKIDHNSAADCPILVKFCTWKQNSMAIEVTWHKLISKTNSRWRTAVILTIVKSLIAISTKTRPILLKFGTGYTKTRFETRDPERVQQLTGPPFWAIYLDRSSVWQLSTKGPGHFSWIHFKCRSTSSRSRDVVFTIVVREIFVNWKIFIMCSWRFWSI